MSFVVSMATTEYDLALGSLTRAACFAEYGCTMEKEYEEMVAPDRSGHHLLLRVDDIVAGYAKILPYDFNGKSVAICTKYCILPKFRVSPYCCLKFAKQVIHFTKELKFDALAGFPNARMVTLWKRVGWQVSETPVVQIVDIGVPVHWGFINYSKGDVVDELSYPNFLYEDSYECIT